MYDEKYLNELVSNVKKTNICKTSYGNSIYSNLWYVDNTNKVCITFTPRGGCSISFQQYLDLVGLLDDGLKYSKFIHDYRCDIVNENIEHCDIQELIQNNYTFIKFIMNPYIRAVSIYRAHTSHNYSFREYLKKQIEGKIILNENDKYHIFPQYIDGEEDVINKYIKIDEHDTYQIKLYNDMPYIIDVNKYTSIHHGVKINHNIFCGDIPKNVVNNMLPTSYKYFYDNEIKEMVDKLYNTDIKNYGFNFF